MTIESLIFVDVDGVLNIGIEDPQGAPLTFSADNLQTAWRMVDMPDVVAQRIRSVAAREIGHDEHPTWDGCPARYEQLMAENNGLSPVLVRRLADLISIAGTQSKVVLSSKWRNKQHAAARRSLEVQLSAYLGRDFMFDDFTALHDEKDAMGRLEILGDYVEHVCQQRRSAGVRKLQILVLDDFFNTNLAKLSCKGFAIDSPSAAERYLHGRTGKDPNVSIRVVHTYDHWISRAGLPVSIGCGLTAEHTSYASDFLTSSHGTTADKLQDSGCEQDPSFPIQRYVPLHTLRMRASCTYTVSVSRKLWQSWPSTTNAYIALQRQPCLPTHTAATAAAAAQLPPLPAFQRRHSC
jgi:hypothetical protein